MNQSDMILEFIDGTLDGGSEQSLFDEMAQHPELRAELRQYVMIGDAVRADREAYTPPADVERRLLGGLGLFPLVEAGGGAAAGVAATGGTAAGTGTAFGWLTFLQLKSILLPLVAGLLIGGGGVFIFMNHSSDSGEKIASVSSGTGREGVANSGKAGSAIPSASALKNGSPQIPSLQVPSAQSPAISSSANQPSLRTFPGTTRTREGIDRVERSSSSSVTVNDLHSSNNGLSLSNILVTVEKEQPSGPSDSQNKSASELRAILKSEPSPNVPLIDPNASIPTEDPNRYRSPSALPQPAMEPKKEIGTKRTFALEFRKGVVSQPFADNNARQVESQFFGNFLREDFAVGAYYIPDDNWYLGLEVGRERFAQTLFYNHDDTLFVEQRPAVAWAGGTLGRNMEAFGMPFFVQGTLGASQYGGPMARGRAGVDLLDFLPGRSLSSTFSLPLSFEATSLVYTYNGQYLVTGNWGFNMGAQVRFGL